jgi:TonB-dependent receptor-like protein
MRGHRKSRALRNSYTLLRPVLVICGALAIIVTPGLARADAAAPAAPAGANTGPLEEIVVTATRRDEGLSKVPISVTALSQADMDVRGIKDILDVARFTPGMNIDNSGTNNIAIRGIASTGGAGTTGIYLDDTPIQIRALAFNPDDTLPSRVASREIVTGLPHRECYRMDLSLNLIHSSATARSAASAAEGSGGGFLGSFRKSRTPEKLWGGRSRPYCHLGYPPNLDNIAIVDQDVCPAD